jgi:hypothetical protein
MHAKPYYRYFGFLENLWVLLFSNLDDTAKKTTNFFFNKILKSNFNLFPDENIKSYIFNNKNFNTKVKLY